MILKLNFDMKLLLLGLFFNELNFLFVDMVLLYGFVFLDSSYDNLLMFVLEVIIYGFLILIVF